MRDVADALTAAAGRGAGGERTGAPSRPAALAAFVVGLAALVAYAVLLDRAGWSDAGALALQHAVERLRDADGPTLSLFGLMHPHLPVSVVWALQGLPGLQVATAQVAATVLVGAWAMAHWHGALARSMPRPVAWAALVLVLANPWIGWALTASLPSAMALAAFHGLCLAVIELVDDDAPQALMRVAGWLLLMFFIDARAVWVAAALAPMFALVRPRARAFGAADRIAEPAPLSAVLLVVYLPLLFAFGSWCYVNWLFAGDPLQWIAPDAARSAGEVRDAIDAAATPRTAGGRLLDTASAGLLLAAAFPVAGLLVAHARRGARRAGWALAMVPAIAALLATALGKVPEPAQVLSLGAATVLAGLCRVPAGEGAGAGRARSFRVAMLALLALGAALAWALALHGPAALGGAGVRGWAVALTGDGTRDTVASASAAPAPSSVEREAPAVAPPPAALPAPPPAAATIDPDAAEPRQALSRSLALWAAAWSDKRADDYLDFYDATFETPDGIARADWEALRRQRVGRPDPIRLRIDEVEVSVEGTQGRTRFLQTWSVPGRTEVVRKSLRWVLRDGRWRIVHERATPAEPAPGPAGAAAAAAAAAPADPGPGPESAPAGR